MHHWLRISVHAWVAIAVASASFAACSDDATRAQRSDAHRAATLAALSADADRCLSVGQAFGEARACLERIGYRAFADPYLPNAQAYQVKDRFAIISIRLDRPGGQVQRWDGHLESPSGRF